MNKRKLFLLSFMILGGVMTIGADYRENPFTLVYDGAITENIKGKVNIHPVSYKVNGINIAANIYTPANYNPNKKYPAVIVAHPNSSGTNPVDNLIDLAAFDAVDNAELINQPLLMIAGDKADSLYMTEEVFKAATGTKNKELSAPSSNFTGNAKVKMLFSHDSTNLSAGVVNFEAGARTNWHTHPKGQMLVITEGKGWTQEENGKVIEFKEGDIIWIPANVKHWHGASPDSSMSHLAITPEDENQKSTDWFTKVTDSQYKK